MLCTNQKTVRKYIKYNPQCTYTPTQLPLILPSCERFYVTEPKFCQILHLEKLYNNDQLQIHSKQKTAGKFTNYNLQYTYTLSQLLLTLLSRHRFTFPNLIYVKVFCFILTLCDICSNLRCFLCSSLL